MEIIPSVMLDGESSAPSSASGTRRKVFAKSKSVKTCYSMPAPVRIIFRLFSRSVSQTESLRKINPKIADWNNTLQSGIGSGEIIGCLTGIARDTAIDYINCSWGTFNRLSEAITFTTRHVDKQMNFATSQWNFQAHPDLNSEDETDKKQSVSFELEIIRKEC